MIEENIDDNDIEVINNETVEEASQQKPVNLEKFLKELKEKRRLEMIKRKQKFYFFEESDENKEHASICEGLVDDLLKAKNSVKNERKQRKAIAEAFKNVEFQGINLYQNTEQQYRLGMQDNQFYLVNKEDKAAKADFVSHLQGKKIMLIVVGNLFHLADFKADKQMSIHVSI